MMVTSLLMLVYITKFFWTEGGFFSSMEIAHDRGMVLYTQQASSLHFANLTSSNKIFQLNADVQSSLNSAPKEVKAISLRDSISAQPNNVVLKFFHDFGPGISSGAVLTTKSSCYLISIYLKSMGMLSFTVDKFHC